MKFFGGFGFKDDLRILEPILYDLGYLSKISNKYNICGFSYGAQKALRHVLNALESGVRINRVLLLSPAFFNDKSEDFILQQLKSFAKNRKIYMRSFYKNVGVCVSDEIYLREVENIELHILEECLRYKFRGEDLEYLKAYGVEIIVILGGMDKIINIGATNDFFSKYGIVYLIKNANHLLR